MISIIILLPLLPLIQTPAIFTHGCVLRCNKVGTSSSTRPACSTLAFVIACSIALFNFSGLGVTKYVSATFSLLQGGRGFGLLVYGDGGSAAGLLTWC